MTTTTTFQAINIGGSPNDGSGDNLRAAFIKVNDNFNNLVDIGFDTGNINAVGDVTIGNPNLGTGDLVINNRINIGNVLLTPIAYPTALINAIVEVDDFSQFNIQNVSEGVNCSADMVCSTSDADDTIGFVNMGINGQNYDVPGYWTVSKPRDGYLYVAGGNLTIGTDQQSRGSPIGNDVRIHVGGLLAGNIVTTFNSSNVTVRANLVVGSTYAPVTSSDGGIVGTIAFDSGNIYICTAPNTWKRAALSTF